MTDQESTKNPNYPSAFPHLGILKKKGANPELSQAQTGMDLRDYFAGQLAPAALELIGAGRPDVIAQTTYEIADAMLQERQRVKE